MTFLIIRFCLDKGGKLLTINDQQMNDWVKSYLINVGISEIGLGTRRDLDLPWEARGGIVKKFKN